MSGRTPLYVAITAAWCPSYCLNGTCKRSSLTLTGFANCPLLLCKCPAQKLTVQQHGQHSLVDNVTLPHIVCAFRQVCQACKSKQIASWCSLCRCMHSLDLPCQGCTFHTEQQQGCAFIFLRPGARRLIRLMKQNTGCRMTSRANDMQRNDTMMSLHKSFHKFDQPC